MRAVRRLCVLLLLTALAAPSLALAAPAKPPAAAPPAEQKLFFRVLDSQDRPLPSASLSLEPLAGAPQGEAPFAADPDGVIHLSWRPAAQQTQSTGGDQTIRYTSAFRWRINAPGHIDARGSVHLEDKSRRMGDPSLKTLNREAKFAPRGETVVLRKTADLFAFPVPDPPDKDPLARACLAFRAKNSGVAQRLGARFAWPAFAREGDTLSILFDWVGAPWGSTAPAPLTARVTLLTGLPLMLAAGQELAALPGVTRLSLVFHSSLAPAGDEMAMPESARVVLTAPLDQVRGLARGELKAGAFLANNPPRLVKGR